MTDDTVPNLEPSYRGPCGHCGAVADGMWPHPLGDPCPLTLDAHNREQNRRDDANRVYIAKLDAERAAAVATGRAGVLYQIPDLAYSLAAVIVVSLVIVALIVR